LQKDEIRVIHDAYFTLRASEAGQPDQKKNDGKVHRICLGF
jgi:hypothetical protein